jgi:hypothetical protein
MALNVLGKFKVMWVGKFLESSRVWAGKVLGKFEGAWAWKVRGKFEGMGFECARSSGGKRSRT